MKHIFADLESACAFVGVVCPPNVSMRLNPTTWVLVPIVGHRYGNTSGRIRLFPDRAGGVVYNWVTGEKAVWVKHSTRKLTKEEIRQKREEQHALEAKALAEQMERYQAVAVRATEIYHDIPNLLYAFNHDYWVKKNLSLYLRDTVDLNWDYRVETIGRINLRVGFPLKHQGKRIQGAVVVVPLRDSPCNPNVSSLQFIDNDGNKTMLAGGKIKGNAWYPFSFKNPSRMHATLDYATIGICEGVATAMSIYKMSGFYTIAAMSCTNLKSVALKIRKTFPNARIVIFGDKGNGERDAYLAAQAVSGDVKIPSFTRECLVNFMTRTGSNKPTDFNDLMVGLNEDSTD